MSKFKSQEPQHNSANNVASFAAARQRQAERAAAVTMAQQVHPSYPSDNPLGRAFEAGVPGAIPNVTDNVVPLTIDTKVEAQVPQGKAGE